MKAQQFDETFEEGAPILDQLDGTKAQRPGMVARQALIKVWLAERIEQVRGR